MNRIEARGVAAGDSRLASKRCRRRGRAWSTRFGASGAAFVRRERSIESGVRARGAVRRPMDSREIALLRALRELAVRVGRAEHFAEALVFDHGDDRELHQVAPVVGEIGERLGVVGLEQDETAAQIGARQAADELRAGGNLRAELLEARDAFGGIWRPSLCLASAPQSARCEISAVPPGRIDESRTLASDSSSRAARGCRRCNPARDQPLRLRGQRSRAAPIPADLTSAPQWPNFSEARTLDSNHRYSEGSQIPPREGGTRPTSQRCRDDGFFTSISAPTHAVCSA